HVSAKDRGTGQEQSMTITGGSALPEEEIDRMVKEAEEHAAEDAKRREEQDTRNSAEQLAYSTEKLLTDNADQLPGDGPSEGRDAPGGEGDPQLGRAGGLLHGEAAHRQLRQAPRGCRQRGPRGRAEGQDRARGR